MDAYEQNKKLSISLLSLYEATSKDTSGKARISYDQAYTILNTFTDAFSLDHLMVQTPDPDSESFKYYKNPKNGTLVLKEGNDFPPDIVSGMDYDTFTRRVLNQIGNLRIYYKDKNSGRQNTSIDLREYASFCSYQSIQERGTDLINLLIDDCLPMPQVEISKIQTAAHRKSEAGLPKMDQLIEFGLIHPGNQVYITVKPTESVATLLDAKYVDYKGNKITLNDWGCQVTGWSAIRIYSYVAVVGETETLHQKRLAYVNEHNEP